MKPVVLTPQAWHRLRKKLHIEYPPSYFFKDKMRLKLGFSVREHTAWVRNDYYEMEVAKWELISNSADRNYLLPLEPSKGYSVQQIHLDFYSENKRTMFLLKYSEDLHD